RLEQLRLRVGGDVLGDDEFAERAAALGVHDTLGYPLAVGMCELLEQVVVVEQDRALGTGGQRLVVAGDGDTDVVRGVTGIRHGDLRIRVFRVSGHEAGGSTREGAGPPVERVGASRRGN